MRRLDSIFVLLVKLVGVTSVVLVPDMQTVRYQIEASSKSKEETDCKLGSFVKDYGPICVYTDCERGRYRHSWECQGKCLYEYYTLIGSGCATIVYRCIPSFECITDGEQYVEFGDYKLFDHELCCTNTNCNPTCVVVPETTHDKDEL